MRHEPAASDTSHHHPAVKTLLHWLGNVSANARQRRAVLGALMGIALLAGCNIQPRLVGDEQSLGRTCEPGVASCGGANDCSTRLMDDPMNCGACGVQCTESSGGTTCVEGTCTASCGEGHLDCNGDGTGHSTADGCEIDSRNDPNHCGGCGVVCGADQICDHGACTSCNGASLNGMCSYSLQCGCPTDQNCVVADLTTGAGQCVRAGSILEESYCGSFDACSRGNGCFGSVCKPYCETNDDCEPGGKCVAATTSSNGDEIPGLKFCQNPCNPVLGQAPHAGQVSCGDLAACGLERDGVYCTKAGSLEKGDDCEHTKNTCGPGLVCSGKNGEYRCHEVCEVGTMCDEDRACVGTYDPSISAGHEYGACPLDE